MTAMALNEDDKAELVAYLDGELDEVATQAVEAKIASDPDARAELDALRLTWGMLDFLPKASPSPNFTNRTMERLTLEDMPASKTMPMPKPVPGWMIGVSWAAVVLLAVGGGYWASTYFWSSPEQYGCSSMRAKSTSSDVLVHLAIFSDAQVLHQRHVGVRY